MLLVSICAKPVVLRSSDWRCLIGIIIVFATLGIFCYFRSVKLFMNRKLHLLFKKIPAQLKPGTTGEYSVGFIIACLIVIILRITTNTSSPFNEAIYYTDMAQNGFVGNSHLAAPFAYRPIVPLVVHIITLLFGISTINGFIIIATLSAVLLLFLTFLFVRNLGGSLTTSLVAMGVIGCSFYHVKYPLFIPSMVDVEAYVLMLLAMWALLKKKFILCALISMVGVLFKEFLLIPPFIMILILLKESFDRRSLHNMILILFTIIVVGISFALPRMLLHIPDAMDFQEIHRYPGNVRWRMMMRTPFDYLNSINVLFAMLSYWFPTILLATSNRIRHAKDRLREKGIYIIIYIALVILFTIFGGTNHSIFITYSFVAQAFIIMLFVDRGIYLWEIIFLFGAMIIFNRLFYPIPLPSDNFYNFIEFYGGWSSLVTWHSMARLLELTGFVAVNVMLRKILSRYQKVSVQ